MRQEREEESDTEKKEEAPAGDTSQFWRDGADLCHPQLFHIFCTHQCASVLQRAVAQRHLFVIDRWWQLDTVFSSSRPLSQCKHVEKGSGNRTEVKPISYDC